jgi:hypothetical protein
MKRHGHYAARTDQVMGARSRNRMDHRHDEISTKKGLLFIKVLLTLAYVAGAIEIIGSVFLWIRGREVFGASLLACTMAGAVLAHLLFIGTSAIPALILGLMSAVVVYAHRDQLAR